MAKFATSAPIWSHMWWSNTFARVAFGPNDELRNFNWLTEQGGGLESDTPAAEGFLRRDPAVSCHSRRLSTLGEPISDLAGRPVGTLDDLSVKNKCCRDARPEV